MSSIISRFVKNVFPSIRKSELNFAADIVLGIIESESIVISDIALSIFKNHPFVLLDSIERRIRRFFNNSLYSPEIFYDKFIHYVIDTYKLNHSDSRVHISFDHMFVKDKFSVLMFTLRIAKQGIPLFFNCFPGKSSKGFNLSFNSNVIKNGILYCHNLFANKNFDLIFLADRWFGNHFDFLEYIDSLGDTYVVRTMSNVKTFEYDKHEKHKVWKTILNMNGYKYHSNIFYDIFVTNKKFKTNLIVSKAVNQKEVWNILTNGDPKRAIRDYAYRFGSIECLFKNQYYS